MDSNAKKKLLYKEKPLASLLHSDSTYHIYWCETSKGAIHFKVPVSEVFPTPVHAQLLIRWLN